MVFARYTHPPTVFTDLTLTKSSSMYLLGFMIDKREGFIICSSAFKIRVETRSISGLYLRTKSRFFNSKI